MRAVRLRRSTTGMEGDGEEEGIYYYSELTGVEDESFAAVAPSSTLLSGLYCRLLRSLPRVAAERLAGNTMCTHYCSRTLAAAAAAALG